MNVIGATLAFHAKDLLHRPYQSNLESLYRNDRGLRGCAGDRPWYSLLRPGVSHQGPVCEHVYRVPAQIISLPVTLFTFESGNVFVK